MFAGQPVHAEVSRRQGEQDDSDPRQRVVDAGRGPH